MKRKVYYYNDELNDEFSGVTRNKFIIDENYKYKRKGILWKILEFIVYRICVMPFTYVYMKIKFAHKIVGKKKLKASKGKGYFMYGNHTLMAGDAFIPNIINYPTKTYTVVNSDNVSVWLTRGFIIMCGALPLPSTLDATKNFVNYMEDRIKNNKVIQIYPEAHIWPYYTGIRPFKSSSFKYPIKFQVATYSITNTFHRRKFSKNPKIITYIDGPFYTDTTLPLKEQEKTLRDMVYDNMCENAKKNTYEIHKYIKEKDND